MSLDLVELVLRTEEVFGITIPDEDAEQIRTVGDLYRQVLKTFQLPYEPAPPRHTTLEPGPRTTPEGEHWTAPEVWRTVHHIVTDQLQVADDEVYEDANFQTDLGAD